MIEVRHLSKRYGTHLAVDDLSFSIDRGVVYGFLGPNGAGKSTTMNIMTGCLGATEGEVLIDGHNVAEEPMEAKKHIGYLPELPPLYGDMTPEEYLRFVARAKGLRREESARQIETVMEKTRIADVRKRLIRNLSKGYRQRVGIAQALLGNPEVIILDEPTVGLDPAQIIEIRELIRELGPDFGKEGLDGLTAWSVPACGVCGDDLHAAGRQGIHLRYSGGDIDIRTVVIDFFYNSDDGKVHHVADFLNIRNSISPDSHGSCLRSRQCHTPHDK